MAMKTVVGKGTEAARINVSPRKIVIKKNMNIYRHTNAFTKRSAANIVNTELYVPHRKSDKHALILRKHSSYLRLALALAPELVLELPELLEDELERDVDPDVELWDELDPLDDRELLSDELQNNNTKQATFITKKQ